MTDCTLGDVHKVFPRAMADRAFRPVRRGRGEKCEPNNQGQGITAQAGLL